MRAGSGMQVLHLRDFRLTFGASVVSQLGDGIAPLALTFAVLDSTGSATDLGIVLAARTLALVGSLLIGGVVSDRMSRRAVMISADLARLTSQATIGALLLAGHTDVATLAVSQAVLGVATGFFNPASSGLIPTVAGEWVQQANSLRGIAMAAGRLAGPAIAGVLVVATSPGVALLADAASYGVSALLLARVHRDARIGAAERFLAELKDGLAEVRARTWLWTTISALAIVNAAGAAFPVLGALVVKRHLGGPGAWAAILVAQGLGALAGGSALLRFEPRRPLLVATLIGTAPVAVTVLVALIAPLSLVALAAFLGGIGNMAFNTLWETTLQQHVPEAARSRVSSYDWFGSLGLTAVGLALVGPLAAAMGTSSVLYLSAGVEFAAVSSLLLVPEIRTLPRTPARAHAVTPGRARA